MIVVKPPAATLALRTECPAVLVTMFGLPRPLPLMYSDYVAELIAADARGPPVRNCNQFPPPNGQCYYDTDRFLRLH